MTALKTAEMTHEDISNRTETGQTPDRKAAKAKLPKTHQGYWESRLRKRTYEYDGKTVEISTWQARIQHLGRESWFNTNEPNKAKASAKARDIYLDLITHGWDFTLLKHKPDMQVKAGGGTVGEFLDQIHTAGIFKPITEAIYFKKFRSCVAGVIGIDGGKEKFDYVTGGREKWLARIHAVQLGRVTPDRVNKWKSDYLKSADGNPLKLKRARVTVNSILRSCKSLFTPQVLKHVTVEIPKPGLFEGVENPIMPKGQSRYKSEIDPAGLLQEAKRELGDAKGEDADEKHEIFKIILLGLAAGLRRNEIDKLQVRQILWKKNLIRVETTAFASVKTDGSEADIPVDPALLELLRQHLKQPMFPADFVIFSRVKPRLSSKYYHYRCARLFKLANQWLKSKGVTEIKAVHALRKEFGSTLNAVGGLMAASQALRHSNIKTTAAVYVDQRPVAFPVAKLLADEKIESIAAGKRG